MSAAGSSPVQVTVRIPTPLRSFTGGVDEVAASGGTVGDVLAALGQRHAGLLSRLLDGEGRVRHFVNVYVGQQDIRSLQGLDSPVRDGDVLSIIPAVAGGTAGSAAGGREVAA